MNNTNAELFTRLSCVGNSGSALLQFADPQLGLARFRVGRRFANLATKD